MFAVKQEQNFHIYYFWKDYTKFAFMRNFQIGESHYLN